MSTTKEWAESLNVASDPDLSAVPGFSELYARTARDVAIRAVILQGVAAVAYKVKPQPIIEWFQAQGIWEAVTAKEQIEFRWKQEAQWTLLWMIQRVESLGLPTRYCDTRRLVDEIIPALGDDLNAFINQSELRSPGALLAEDDRTYDL